MTIEDSMKNDGGPAFPHTTFQHDGMSLRDWFAGQALAGLAVNEQEYGSVVLRAYEIADAMLEARK